MTGGAAHQIGPYFRMRVVLVEAVSSAISSALFTAALSRTVPSASFWTSTTLRSFDVASSLPVSAASWTARPSLVVAVASSPDGLGGQALLDHRRQLGLTRVVGDLLVDLGGELGVVGPGGLHERLGEHVVADGELHPGGELLLADRLGRDAHRHVVVARLVGPRAGRVGAGERVDVGAAGGEVLDGRRDLAHEEHLGALRRPHPQLGVGDAARHRGAHHLLELPLHLRRAPG